MAVNSTEQKIIILNCNDKEKKKTLNKVLLIGDSVTKGVLFMGEGKYKLSHNKDYPEIAELGIPLVNMSRMGATADVVEANFKRSEADMNTLIIFEFGGNDCDHKWAEISDAPELNTHVPYLSLEQYSIRFKDLIEKAKTKAGEVAICNLVPIDAHKYARHISQGLSYDNIIKWLGDENMLYRWHEQYSLAAERVARETGCRLIDVRAPFLCNRNFQKLLCEDGIHPTEEGYGILRQTIADAVSTYFD